MKQFLLEILAFYQKYFMRGIIGLGFVMGIFGVFYVGSNDVDSLYYLQESNSIIDFFDSFFFFKF